MNDFNQLFPDFARNMAELYDSLMPFSPVLAFIGVAMLAWKAPYQGYVPLVMRMVGAGILGWGLTIFPEDVFEWQANHVPWFIEQANLDPQGAHEAFGKFLGQVMDSQEGEMGWQEAMSQFGTSFGLSLIYALTLMIGWVAWNLQWYALLIQNLVLYFAVGVAPIFLGLFMINSTQGVAMKYAMALAGILAWPLGWAVSSEFTDALIVNLENDGAGIQDGELYVFSYRILLFILPTSLWIIASTFFVPYLIQKAIVAGVQVSGGVIAGAAEGVSGGKV